MTETPYSYTCPQGHDPTSPKPLAACPGYWLGQRCEGPLKQVGGPRAARNSTTPHQSVSTAAAK